MNIEFASWGSHFAAFLVGALTGAAGKYLAEKYTDQRRKAEGHAELRRRFDEVRSLLPRFFEELRATLDGDEARHVREFFLMPNRHAVVAFNDKARLMVYEDDFPRGALRHVVDRLVEIGLVEEATPRGGPVYENPGRVPIFRMREDFVAMNRSTSA